MTPKCLPEYPKVTPTASKTTTKLIPNEKNINFSENGTIRRHHDIYYDSGTSDLPLSDTPVIKTLSVELTTRLTPRT